MIGEKIKAARIEKGLTAKELAIKSEVTPGYISQIERELISPSLSVLMRIAKVLEIPIVSLFSQEEQEQVTVIKKDNRTKIRFADINMEYQYGVSICNTIQQNKKHLHTNGNHLFLFGPQKLGQFQSAVPRRSSGMCTCYKGNFRISHQ